MDGHVYTEVWVTKAQRDAEETRRQDEAAADEAAAKALDDVETRQGFSYKPPKFPFYVTSMHARARVLKAQAALARSGALPSRLVQLDDGFQRAWGDWDCLDQRKFPFEDMPRLAAAISALGLTPGLWLAPGKPARGPPPGIWG